MHLLVDDLLHKRRTSVNQHGVMYRGPVMQHASLHPGAWVSPSRISKCSDLSYDDSRPARLRVHSSHPLTPLGLSQRLPTRKSNLFVLASEVTQNQESGRGRPVNFSAASKNCRHGGWPIGGLPSSPRRRISLPPSLLPAHAVHAAAAHAAHSSVLPSQSRLPLTHAVIRTPNLKITLHSSFR